MLSGRDEIIIMHRTLIKNFIYTVAVIANAPISNKLSPPEADDNDANLLVYRWRGQDALRTTIILSNFLYSVSSECSNWMHRGV